MKSIKNKEELKIAVLGAGHGGTAMAGHLSLLGFDVSLYNRTAERIRIMRHSGGIEIISDQNNIPQGFAPIKIISSDLKEVIKGRDILMVVLPATGHLSIAENMAPFLEDNQIVVLNPGRTGGALEVLNTIRKSGCQAKVTVCEAQTLLYTSRSLNPGQTRIIRIKNSVPVAAIPAHETAKVVKQLRVALPQFIPGDNVMKTSLDNIGSIFHPALTVLNAGRIESTNGDFEYYTEGITPSVALVLEKLDKERVAVSESLGFHAMTAREWLYIAYDAAGKTLYEAMRNNRGYDGIKAPRIIATRYISEDIPMSLVPIAHLGALGEVETPAINSIILLGSIMHGVDYWSLGRDASRMGLAHMTLKEIRTFITEGD